MAAAEQTIETPLTLRLSPGTCTKLAARASDTGQDISDVVSDMIEHAVNRPSIDEIMAPVRKEVAESGMSDEELDDFFRSELEAHRREKKAKAS